VSEDPGHDRRARFFVLAAVVAAALVPVADPEHRWVAVALSIAYLVLATASWLDSRSRAKVPPRFHGRG
jgi:hypothetical protein